MYILLHPLVLCLTYASQDVIGYNATIILILLENIMLAYSIYNIIRVSKWN